MTELYRGLLLVLTENFNELIAGLRDHIRSFNKNPGSEVITTFGFWNLILEIIFTVFVILCLFVGVTLVFTLAVFAYLPKALLDYSAWLLKNTRNPAAEPAVATVTEESPVIIKKPEEKK